MKLLFVKDVFTLMGTNDPVIAADEDEDKKVYFLNLKDRKLR